MRSSISRLVAGAALVSRTAAILVTSQSSCYDQCGNTLDATFPADIECDQSNYGSAAGVVFKNCLSCEISSTAYETNPNKSDQQWMLYNSRYALSECLWGQPGNNHVEDSPCITSRACGSLQSAIQYGNLSANTIIGPYEYCVNWQNSTFYDGCVTCLRESNQEFLANMVVLLDVGCSQKPAPGSKVSVTGSIFSTTLMNATILTPASSWTSVVDAGPISLGGKVGIAIGALCLVLAVTGFCIVCNGRRRRRAFLRKLEMRHKDGGGWPHPYAAGGISVGAGGGIINRGPDMNETPLSQKPLRGWDDSPQSATASEPSSYARHFSPYASQQTSPVNGTGAQMLLRQWPQQFHDEPTYGGGGFPSAAHEQMMRDHSFPSSAQEKTMQDQHEAATAAGTTKTTTTATTTTMAAGLASAPLHIGLAFGGDEPSLRSKASGASASAQNKEADVESYELHEVSSSAGSSFRNRVARENRTPVLHHPGYGRYSPDRMLPPPPLPPILSMSGGLLDDGENRI